MSSDNFNVFDIFDPKDFEDISRIKRHAQNLFHSGIPATLSEHGILAGGCFASWMHTENPADYDIFLLDTLKNRDMYYSWFIRYLIPEAKDIFKLSKGYFHTNSNIKEVWYHTKYKAQYIWTKYQTREELIADFDLMHTKVSYMQTDDGDRLYISKQTLDAIRSKKLIPAGKQKIREGRKNKFLDRGWTIDDANFSVATTGPVTIQSQNPCAEIPLKPITISGSDYNSVVIGNTGKWSINPYTMQPTAINADQGLSDKQIKELIDEFFKPRKPVEMTPLGPAEKIPPKAEKTSSWFEEFKKTLTRSWDH